MTLINLWTKEKVIFKCNIKIFKIKSVAYAQVLWEMRDRTPLSRHSGEADEGTWFPI